MPFGPGRQPVTRRVQCLQSSKKRATEMCTRACVHLVPLLSLSARAIGRHGQRAHDDNTAMSARRSYHQSRPC